MGYYTGRIVAFRLSRPIPNSVSLQAEKKGDQSNLVTEDKLSFERRRFHSNAKSLKRGAKLDNHTSKQIRKSS
ncbi:unnamed protein product [Periconia digitata]|uniref:Uncharacterized protein n=1 Tax=Periconia digitata TaxID=1303443 RepID=A0A9W4UJ64_9PLEO|nr:unnamed protein product [Periconia digitata]